MKLLLSFLLIPVLCSAQVTQDNPVRIHLYGTALIPSKNFKAGKNNNLVFGQTMDGSGGGIALTIPLKNRFHIGFGTRILYFNLNHGMITKQVYDRYKNTPGYATSPDMANSIDGYYFHQLTLEGSWLFQSKIVDIEPCVRVGLVALQHKSSLDRVRVIQQNLQTGETEFIRLKIEGGQPFLGHFVTGIRLNRVVSKKFINVFASANYVINTRVKHTFSEERILFDGSSTKLREIPVQYNANMFQFDIGVQLRLWRNPRRNQ